MYTRTHLTINVMVAASPPHIGRHPLFPATLITDIESGRAELQLRLCDLTIPAGLPDILAPYGTPCSVLRLNRRADADQESGPTGCCASLKVVVYRFSIDSWLMSKIAVECEIYTVFASITEADLRENGM